MEQDNSNTVSYVQWRPEWKTETLADIVSLRALLEASPEAVGGGIVSSSTFSDTVGTLVFKGDILTFSRIDGKGSPLETYVATPSVVNRTVYRTGTPHQKTWTLYYDMIDKYVWKCTYNENPTSPKHMLSRCIPTTGRQLHRELQSLLDRRSPTREKLALESAINNIHWKDELSKAEIDTLYYNFMSILRLFKSEDKSAYPSAFYEKVLGALQVAAVDVSQMSHNSLLSRYLTYISVVRNDS